MTAPTFILYGAEAKPRTPLSKMEQLRTAARRKLHGYRDVTHFRHGDLSHLDYRNYLGPDVINLGDVAISQSVTAFLTHAVDRPLHYLNWGELDALPPHEPGTQETIVFAGSGYFFLRNGRLAPRIAHDLHVLEQRGAHAIFFGIGLNFPDVNNSQAPTTLYPEDAQRVTQLLDRADGISVRDAGTQAALSPLTNRPVHLIGDPALHFCALHAISQNPRPPSMPKERPVIGLNLFFHGPDVTILLQRNLDAYATALKTLQQETGCQFHYFVHFETERVLPKLLAVRGLSVKVVAGDTATLAQGYGKLDLHIGGMLHSCILATSAGTPCIGLAYDIKHQGFFDLMGLAENCLSAAEFSPALLLERAHKLLADPQPVRKQIAQRRTALETATRAFVASCQAALGRPSASSADLPAVPNTA